MTSYAVVADVERRLEAWFTTPFGGATEPTDTEVEDYIDQVEAEINGTLAAQGYNTVPATGTNDVKMLKRYVSQQVAVMVWQDEHTGMDEMPYPFRQWARQYDEFIKRLRMGQQHLVDQTPQSEDDAVFSIVRHPTRDDYFTDRLAEPTDWDE